MSDQLIAIHERLMAATTEKAKASIRNFVPHAEKVYGVTMPLLNELAKEFKTGGFPLVKELWKSGAYEERILAAKLLGKVCRKDPVLSLQLAERFSKDISNWAVCDAMGMQALKPVAGKIREEIFLLAEKLVLSDNPWQRRYSLVLVEVFTKDQTAGKRIGRLVQELEKDEDYYVRKAVSWIKRNLSKGR
ncbi:MAG: hypothetical protein GC171_13600 [Terrimonas sp.]|nr:hypothetical protein [Terrimonas sp.]